MLPIIIIIITIIITGGWPMISFEGWNVAKKGEGGNSQQGNEFVQRIEAQHFIMLLWNKKYFNIARG